MRFKCPVDIHLKFPHTKFAIASESEKRTFVCVCGGGTRSLHFLSIAICSKTVEEGLEDGVGLSEAAAQ